MLEQQLGAVTALLGATLSSADPRQQYAAAEVLLGSAPVLDAMQLLQRELGREEAKCLRLLVNHANDAWRVVKPGLAAQRPGVGPEGAAAGAAPPPPPPPAPRPFSQQPQQPQQAQRASRGRAPRNDLQANSQDSQQAFLVSCQLWPGS